MTKDGIPRGRRSDEVTYADQADPDDHEKVTVGAASTAEATLPTDAEIIRVVANDGMNIALGVTGMAAADIDSYRLVSGIPERLWVGGYTHYRAIADNADKKLWLGRIA